MKRLSLLFIIGSLVGCSDSIPNVSTIENLFTPTKTQTAQFADANVAGAKRVTTSDSYVGRFTVHSGTSGKTIKTSDNYQLTVRKVSF